jgi:hypothetical protein
MKGFPLDQGHQSQLDVGCFDEGQCTVCGRHVKCRLVSRNSERSEPRADGQRMRGGNGGAVDYLVDTRLLTPLLIGKEFGSPVGL